MAQLDPNSKKEESASSIDNINYAKSPSNHENLNTPDANEENNNNEKVDSEKQNKIIKTNINNSNENNISQTPMASLEYKYAPINIDNTNFISQQNMFNNYNQHNYNLYDYNDQSNYDLYYQSLYQMYPQMSDVKLNSVIYS